MCQIEDFCCQNPLCPDAGIRKKVNLRWHGWSGHKRQIRCLRCMTCMKVFSERKGTVLEHSRLLHILAQPEHPFCSNLNTYSETS